MTPRLRLFYDLRAKGFGIRDALRISEVNWCGGLLFTLWIILLLAIVNQIDTWAEAKAEERAAPYRAQAEENLRAFNHAMNGRPFVLEGEWRALLTCRAQETKL